MDASVSRVWWAISFTVLCASCVVSLVIAESRRHARGRAVSKTLASLCFIAVACCVWTSHSDAAAWIVAGLVLGAIGDVALLGSGQATFLVGLSAFLLGHVACAVAFATLVSPVEWSGVAALSVGVFGAGVLRWLLPRLGSMRVPVVVYIAVLCVMLVGALSVALERIPYGAGIALGAVLFAVSDLAVARDRFVEDAFVNKAWGLPTYYAGQLVLAWAVGYAGS